MRALQLLACVVAVVAGPIAGVARAGTMGSTGEGLWELSAQFTAPDGIESITVPANGQPGTIPRLNKGHLFFQQGLASTPPGQATVQAQGGFAHYTQPSPFDSDVDSHFGVFTVLPAGAFVDNGDLAVGNGVIDFLFEFELRFFVDGTGIGQTPLSLSLPMIGYAPPGYRVHYDFAATWTDTTTGAPQAAAAQLHDADTLDGFNNPMGEQRLVTLTDNAVFGPIVNPAFGDFFTVEGFLLVSVDKQAGAMLPGPPPNFFEIAVIPNVGDEGDGFFRYQPIPEPGSAALLTLALSAAALRRRTLQGAAVSPTRLA